MNEAPGSDRNEFRARKTAIRLGSVFLAAFLLIITLNVIERVRGKPLEQFHEVSAVGDDVYFQRPLLDDKTAFAEPIVSLNGVALYLVDGNKRELKDTNMVRAGRDAATGLSIYTPRKKEEGKEHGRDAERNYFVKLGRNDYLQVRSR